MINLLKYIIADLRTPSSYPNDPIGHIKNQGMHFLIAFYAVTLLTCIVWGITGDYPSQDVMAISVVAAYLIAWEGTAWNGWDSVEDTIFVALGVGAYFVIDFEFVMGRMVGVMLLAFLLLLRGAIGRLKGASE